MKKKSSNFLSRLGYNEKILIFCALIFSSIYLIFFPVFYASIDEHEYAKNAYLLKQGSLITEDPLKACRGTFNGQGFISNYYIGKSLFLLPFTFIGFSALMLSGLIIHLINFFLFYLILKKLKFNPINSLLYLLFPAFIWDMRTLNTELLVLMFLLLGFYFYLSKELKKNYLSGLFFGFACIVRYDALIAFWPFALFSLFKDKKKFFALISGIVLPALFILAYNNYFYGNFFTAGYGNIGTLISHKLNLASSFYTLLFALIVITVMYPLMLLSPIFYKKQGRIEISLVLLSYLLFYVKAYNVLSYDFNIIKNFTTQIRYIIPALGLLLIIYIPLFETILKKISMKIKFLNRNKIFALIILFLFCVLTVASYYHSNFLKDRYTVFQQIYSNTPKNALLVGGSDDCMYTLRGAFEKRRYIRIDAENDLGPTMKNFDVKKFFDDKTYIINLEYSNRRGSESLRQKTIVDKERKAVEGFIIENRKSLQLIFKTDKPHYLEIYKYIPSNVPKP
ncbi:MAG: hypothetical protein AB1467_05635 [Candidatus Diapherotrites archaeon]